MNAAVRSSLAAAAMASARLKTPINTPGGKPVTAVPGLKPTFPLTVLTPVLVMVDPASRAKLAAVPRFTAGTITAGSVGGAGGIRVAMEIAFVSKVTAAVCVNALPSIVAPVVTVIDA